MSAFDLLRQLADGRFHSAQALADRHRVSRSTVSGWVASLHQKGLPVEHVSGRGYRIPGGLELLDESVIRGNLEAPADGLLGEFHLLGEIDSTNADLQRRGAPGAGVAVCLAESQSAGRGRRGRSWVSPFGSSIYLSAARQFPGGAQVLEGLSLAVGVILGESVQALGVPRVTLKWPNDLLLDGRKAAGILVELSGEHGDLCTAVIGIGINVRLPGSQGAFIDQPWTDLQSAAGAPVSRNALVAGLLNRLLPAIDCYEDQGFAHWRERWLALDAHAGKPVIVEQGGRRIAGVASGVDERGALLLQTAAGLQALPGGSVSLRPAP